MQASSSALDLKFGKLLTRRSGKRNIMQGKKIAWPFEVNYFWCGKYQCVTVCGELRAGMGPHGSIMSRKLMKRCPFKQPLEKQISTSASFLIRVVGVCSPAHSPCLLVSQGEIFPYWPKSVFIKNILNLYFFIIRVIFH
jgi:hypothetical protein